MTSATCSEINSIRRESFLRKASSGVMLSALVFLGGFIFHQTEFGDDFSWITFRFLERQLTPPPQVPVTVVDISELALDEHEATPRYKLGLLLQSVVRYNPKVIGVDIDFSPTVDPQTNKQHFIEPGDPDFFADCQQLRNSAGSITPVYLGVYRTEALPAQQWLGMTQFANLAASLLIPKDPRKLLASLAGDDAVTMSAAVARNSGSEGVVEPTWPLEMCSQNKFLVDYSLLQRLSDMRIRISSDSFDSEAKLDALMQSNRENIDGKMVLIGKVTAATDKFDNPVSGHEPTAGVLVNASAAFTLATRPLYDIKEPWRTLADFILAVLILLAVLSAAHLFGGGFNQERLRISLLAVAVLAVFWFGVKVNLHRVLWDDFLLVAMSLALHPLAERIFEPLMGKLSCWLRGKKV